MSLPLVLNKELGIAVTLLVDDELSEFESLRCRSLVRSDDRVESRSFVRLIFAVVSVAAARRPSVRLGILANIGSAEQNSRQYHGQSRPLFRPSGFIFCI